KNYKKISASFKMKYLTLFFFHIILLHSNLCAQNIPLLEKRISVSVSDESIEKTLRLIENKTGITFSYSADQLDVQQKVSLQLQNKTVREALNVIFKNSVQYKEKNNYIILQKLPEAKTSSSSSSFNISGYVLNTATGEHIPFVSIYNTKTLRAVHSDAFGFYSFKIDKPEFPILISYNKVHYNDTLVRIESQKIPT